MDEEDILLKEKMAFDKINQIIIQRINSSFQKKEIDLKKESKLSSALSKSLLCKNITKMKKNYMKRSE